MISVTKYITDPADKMKLWIEIRKKWPANFYGHTISAITFITYIYHFHVTTLLLQTYRISRLMHPHLKLT